MDTTSNHELEVDMNTSFTEVEKQTTKGNSINFSAGEKALLQMHYNYPQFSTEHVRAFIIASPVAGWEIQCHEKFTTATMICDNQTDFFRLFEFCSSKTKEDTKFSLSAIN